MRLRGTLLGVVVLLALLGVTRGHAGDYHITATLVCNDCHIVHYSETHGYTGGAPDPMIAPGGPFTYLLKADQSQICLSCHDGQTFAPDVRGANSAGTYVRAAGALPNGTAPYAYGNGHQLGSTATAPGGTWAAPSGLMCQHCHAKHGNTYYRNLVTNPGTVTGKLVTYMTGSPYSGTSAIQQVANTPMATHYALSNIQYRQTQVSTTDYGISEWCSGCHGNYHGVGGAANMGGSPTGNTTATNPWLRHPTRDVTMANGVTNKHVDGTHWFCVGVNNPPGCSAALASRIPVVSPSGTIPGTSGVSDNVVFCGSCHKAHGSTNRKGLIFDDETTATPEDGTTLMQTCQQCHYQ